LTQAVEQTQRKQADQSFPKRDRLLQRAEFLAATRKGRRFVTRYFLVFLRPNRAGRPRLGMVASRKVGKAVHRNHIKRRLREFFRLHKTWFPPGTDVVIVAKKGAPMVGYFEICQDLERFLRNRPHPSRKEESRMGEDGETGTRLPPETL
jgi:ribonuclease P protein component